MATMSKRDRYALTTAVAKLEAFLTPDDKTLCATDPAVREASRLYLDTWVAPTLRSLLRRAEGTADWRDDIALDSAADEGETRAIVRVFAARARGRQ